MTDLGAKFGINTYSYTQSMSAEQCLLHLAEFGFKTFELMLYPGHLWISDGADVVDRVRNTTEDNGLQLASLNTPNIDLNIAAGTEEMRQHCLDLNSHFLRLAGELGAEAIILGPGKANPLFPLSTDVLEGHFFKALDILLPIAARNNVAIWVENAPFSFVPDAKGLMDLLQRYGDDAPRICYDVTNAHFIGEDPVAGLECVKERLELVHLSDTNKAVYGHDPVGMGDVEFDRFPTAISAACPQRPPVLEIISKNADADILQSAKSLIKMEY